MNTPRRGPGHRLNRFLSGFLAGALGTLVVGAGVLYVLGISGWAVISLPGLPSFHAAWDFVWVNLRHSILVFAAVLVFYFYSLGRLRRLLARPEPPLDQVLHAEQQTDTAITLFFGVGVIWTAIGMESALLYALDDPMEAAEAGAFAILQRLVEGGILLALSTTVVGGVGGYLMRLGKAFSTGARLQTYYGRVSRAQGAEISATLRNIEGLLRRPTVGATEEPEA